MLKKSSHRKKGAQYMNIPKLRGKIAEKEKSYTEIAKVINMSLTGLSLKIKDGRISVKEASAISKFLGLTYDEVMEIFFPDIETHAEYCMKRDG